MTKKKNELSFRGGHGTFLKYRGTGTGTCLKKVLSVPVPVLFLKSTAVTVPALGTGTFW